MFSWINYLDGNRVVKLFGRDLFDSTHPNHLAFFRVGVVVEKVFYLKLVSILIFITDRDRNFNLSYETLKFNLFFLIFVVINSILPDIASRRRVVYERFQIVSTNDLSI